MTITFKQMSTAEFLIDAIRRWPEFAAEAGLSGARAAMLAAEMPATRW